MFTAQQLYEILTHKDDESLRADGQPQKRTADLLYSLLDGYKKNRPDDLLEFDFAEALDTMLQKAEIVKDVVDSLSETKEYFAKQVQDVVDKFHAAYAKLPKQIREQAKLVEFSRELGIAAPREQIKSERRQALKIPVCSTSANDVKKASTSWLEIISPILRKKNGIV